MIRGRIRWSLLLLCGVPGALPAQNLAERSLTAGIEGLRYGFVITSYSIHYTKLYEDPGLVEGRLQLHPCRTGGNLIALGSFLGETSENVEITMKIDSLEQQEVVVITSYSIHYTKLYEHHKLPKTHTL